MAELFMGFMFMLVPGIIIVMVFVTGGFSGGILFIPILFFLIGLFLFWVGLKKFVQNYKTAKKGEICYGYIAGVEPSNVSVNGRPRLDASVVVYVGSKASTEIVKESIGYDYSKYKPYIYVRVKYYEGDINFVEMVAKEQVPYDIQNRLEEMSKSVSSNPIIGNVDPFMNNDTAPIEYVVNGVTYRRIDNDNSVNSQQNINQ